MGILDSVLGGGSQKTETRLPGYVTIPSQDISKRVTALMQQPGQRGFNAPQQSALDAILAEAMGGAGYTGGAEGFLSGLFSGNGLNAPQNDLATGLTGGEFVNPAFAETARVAAGGDVGSNPFLDAAFGRAADVMGENFQDNVIAGMDNGFAASGRLGSKAYAKARGSAEDAYGRQLNDLANEIYGGAYQFDQSRKDAALGQLAGLGQQDIANRVTGAGLFQEGIGNLFGGVDAMPTVDAGRYSDFERLFQAGNTMQDQPWRSVRLGADIINSLQGGSSTMQQANPNMLGQAIGLGTAYMGMNAQIAKALAGGGA